MNTSGSNGIFDGFEIFLMRMQQTKQKFLHDKICPLTFFGTIPVFPLSVERPFPYFAIESLFRFVSISAFNRSKPQSLSPSNILSFV